MVVHAFRPLIRKLPDPINSGNRTSGDIPSPLGRNLHSLKLWKNHESGGVGLAIVAALEKSADGDEPKLNSRVTTPITIVSPRAAAAAGGGEQLGGKMTNNYIESSQEDFLSYCCWCRKGLQGKDIYMYRGEKAFCSIECRFRQIVNDEYQEKCGSEVANQSEMSTSPYSGGRIFFTGIVEAQQSIGDQRTNGCRI
ncbi:FCS-Like Zinc finger 13-like [Typha latifolia]|uniref:FCS-Like Zinc finger 13-like n=1 Tax=Typha latifolia TaxID=4733 RepID=UPI003C2E0C97